MNKFKGVPHIVVPTNRDEETIISFLNKWAEEFEGCVVHIVFDAEETPRWTSHHNEFSFPIITYNWKSIEQDLGKNYWIIPRNTDCVRSYGFYKAWQHEPLFIITLDDDTEPVNNPIKEHYKALYTNKYKDYYNTMKDYNPRGHEVFNEIKGSDVSHGVWVNVPDLNAKDQLEGYEKATINSFNKGLIPKNSYYSMCGMNLAWKPEHTKHMYFGLQGKNHPIDRCGDIWCGYNTTNKGLRTSTGYAVVKHNRASNVWNNYKKESNAESMGLEYLNKKTSDENKEYFKLLDEATRIWYGLFEKN